MPLPSIQLVSIYMQHSSHVSVPLLLLLLLLFLVFVVVIPHNWVFFCNDSLMLYAPIVFCFFVCIQYEISFVIHIVYTLVFNIFWLRSFIPLLVNAIFLSVPLVSSSFYMCFSSNLCAFILCHEYITLGSFAACSV